jgi:putative DNA-invertase from lambdoid prophage Rac
VRNYAYFRIDSLTVIKKNYIDLINCYGYSVHVNRIVTEEVEINTALELRYKFMNLIKNTLKSGDLLIIEGIDSLGSSFKEIIHCINILFKNEVKLVCLEFSRLEISGDIKKIIYHVFNLCSAFEEKIELVKNSAIRKSSKVGRPEVLNSNQKDEILKKYKKGKSINSLAKEYFVTRTVIQRLLSNFSIEIDV